MEAVFLGFALAADAAVVTAAVSVCSARPLRDVSRLSVAFGLAQGLAAALGAHVGAALGGWVGDATRWIAASALAILGILALRAGPDRMPPLTAAAVAALAVATSADALFAGIALPSWGLPVAASATVISGVTAGCCLATGAAGAGLGIRFGRGVSVAGAVGLLGLAAWIAVAG